MQRLLYKGKREKKKEQYKMRILIARMQMERNARERVAV